MGLCMNDAASDDTVRAGVGPGGGSGTAGRATGPRVVMAGQAVPEAVEYTEILEAEDRPWVTVVWDDPVNLMHYVAYIFQKLFGYSKGKATELMLKVHNEGKAVVSSGSRDRMEHDVQRLHAAGLWATMQRDD
ncbi:ATP-dependent Clp protease adaptor protein ClpS [Nocardia sp. GAS34]